ncbi:Erythronate-4-phosphate dehydrogenase [Oleispira antarctica RB-8]|uniref:Erythronate-4-phosphate dehydrogenase n=1 Tax=Oleispira antarctica RB-8 TaxID=698738 RepID=R4YNF3_OLEAN|nr:Erythronate-4-phosphate dehydrogenase [Oleispira antarctica RB-8]
MQIVADENIPLLEQFFSEFGEIRKVAGRTMTSEDVKDADILLVRSVTKVNETLIANSPVKFIGTCTIGTDHIDLAYLDALNQQRRANNQQKIAFSSAPGCNAEAVVDYVLSAVSVLIDKRDQIFQDLSVGIIGVGNVGFRLRRRLEAMGVTVIAVDPFKDAEEVGELSALDDALKADVVSLHIPITLAEDAAEHATYHLINEQRLQKMQPNACLINTCRGSVVDNTALKAHMDKYADFESIIDVWEGEPNLDLQLMNRCMLATPHIAGYSLDGKMRGTEQVYQACCQTFGLPIRNKLAQYLPEPSIKKIKFGDSVPVRQALRTAIRAVYEVRVDDGIMRSTLLRTNGEPQAMRTQFDLLRKNYPLRRDIPTMRVEVPSKRQDLQQALAAAGFDVRMGKR